jgi:hypothetical protein
MEEFGLVLWTLIRARFFSGYVTQVFCLFSEINLKIAETTPAST